jgi:dTDP-glucose 4,6-dehydratase
MNKKILYVTGCLGFIGSHFTRNALKLGWKIYGIDKCTYAANLELLDEFSRYDNFKFEKIDIKDLKFLNDCDFIVNFAAESHVENSIVNSDSFIESNILGVKNLLELIRFKHKNVGDRPILLHISTDEVYGDIVSGTHIEEDLLKPSNPYSASKAAADMMICAWTRTYDIEHVILRPTNNYGNFQFPEKLIPLTIKNLMRNKKIRLHNNGTPVRNWLHVEDTAAAVLKVIEVHEKNPNLVRNKTLNISGGFEQTNSETVKKIVKAFYGDDRNWKDHVDFSYNRVGQDVRYSLNDEKIKSLGWKSEKIFDIEIQNVVNFYKNKFKF